jgi:lipase chaperone LimK
MRMKMPSVVDGAIAASAPIWQLATTVTHETLDWPSMAISRGLSAAGAMETTGGLVNLLDYPDSPDMYPDMHM